MLYMRVINSKRRHRFMETTDFNGAALELFTVLKHMLQRGVPIRPMFASFFMDPLTPGRIITVETLPYEDAGIQELLAAADSEAAGRETAFRQILLSEVRPASLAVLVRPVQATARGLPAQAMVTLDLRSADGSAATAFPILASHAGPKLVRRPLEFRRLAGRITGD